MPHHVVAQGETIASIAKDHSLATWQQIYDHPDNAVFRQKRPNPNLIYPGDVVFVPERETPRYSRPTDQRHKFSLNRPKQWLRIVVQDQDAKPLANTPYDLKVGPKHYKGETDGDGLLAQEIDVSASSGRLKIGDYLFKLSIGYLNPTVNAPDEGVSGVQGRLFNLGYPVGPIDGIIGPRTLSAIRFFQADESLPATGVLDSATRRKLLQIHGV